MINGRGAGRDDPSMMNDWKRHGTSSFSGTRNGAYAKGVLEVLWMCGSRHMKKHGSSRLVVVEDLASWENFLFRL